MTQPASSCNSTHILQVQHQLVYVENTLPSSFTIWYMLSLSTQLTPHIRKQSRQSSVTQIKVTPYTKVLTLSRKHWKNHFNV